MGRRIENVIRTTKLICRCRILLIKTTFQILKYLLKLYLPSIAIACNSKIIFIEMDPPASLTVSVKASSPISRYWSINQHVNFGWCICATYDIMPWTSFAVLIKKRKVWKDIYLQLSSTVCCLYSTATHFSPRNRMTYRRKRKNNKNFMMWMLELFMDVDKLVDVGD